MWACTAAARLPGPILAVLPFASSDCDTGHAATAPWPLPSFCIGFAYKRPYAAFLEHFWQLNPEAVHHVRTLQQQHQQEQGQVVQRGDGRAAGTSGGSSISEGELPAAEVAAARALLDAAGMTGYHCGHTKLFLRSPQVGCSHMGGGVALVEVHAEVRKGVRLPVPRLGLRMNVRHWTSPGSTGQLLQWNR